MYEAYIDDLTNRFQSVILCIWKIKVVEKTDAFENIDLNRKFQDNGEVAENIDKYLIS